MKRFKKGKFDLISAGAALVGGPIANLVIDQLDTRVDALKKVPQGSAIIVSGAALAKLYFFPNKQTDAMAYGALGVSGNEHFKPLTSKLSGMVDDMIAGRRLGGAKNYDIQRTPAFREKISV
jgi:hypothetical protein